MRRLLLANFRSSQRNSDTKIFSDAVFAGTFFFERLSCSQRTFARRITIACLRFVCVRAKIAVRESKTQYFLGLENRYTFGYREFESPPLRIFSTLRINPI